jgi:hypothetical protein
LTFGRPGGGDGRGVVILGGDGGRFGGIAGSDAHGVACCAKLLDKSGAHVAGANNENFHTISFRGFSGDLPGNFRVAFKAWVNCICCEKKDKYVLMQLIVPLNNTNG